MLACFLQLKEVNTFWACQTFLVGLKLCLYIYGLGFANVISNLRGGVCCFCCHTWVFITFEVVEGNIHLKA